MQAEFLKDKMKDNIGKVYPTTSFGDVKVIKYFNYKEVMVEFLNTGNRAIFRAYHIKHGRCRDKFAPSVFGKGIVGDNITKIKGVTTKLYNLWGGMLERCYSTTLHKKYPTYIGCSVSEDWLYLDNFKEWFYIHYKEGFELDKDLLVEGNKLYSEDTCVFVPKTLNNLIKYNNTLKQKDLPTSVRTYSGKFYSYTSDRKCLGSFSSPEDAFMAYKKWKEDRICSLAKHYLEEGSISIELYNVLISYEVKDYV